MTKGEGERLAVLEALLEEKVVKQIEEMRDDLRAIRADLDEDKADLAALKNKGTGILIGVGLAGGALGAAIAKTLQTLFN